WQIEEGDLLGFRCRVGHAYSGTSLLAAEADALDAALWIAFRALEETAACAASSRRGCAPGADSPRRSVSNGRRRRRRRARW
ncbi:MAG TPA: hypothetical protein VFD32_05135, partial [Dehalococcoidia bacterium]|nr:hypothetical protein [Dehalococcoidia bacterium]